MVEVRLKPWNQQGFGLRACDVLQTTKSESTFISPYSSNEGDVLVE
jgi:hypothetical protein